MEFIKLSLEEELAVVTIDRPKSLNALNSHCLLYTSDAADE